MVGIVSNVDVLVADTFLIVAGGLNNRLNQTFAKYSVRAEVISVDASLRTCVATLAGIFGAERYPRLGCRLRARGLRGHQRGDKVFRRDGDATKFQVLRGDASSVVLRRFTDWPDLKADLSVEG